MSPTFPEIDKRYTEAGQQALRAAEEIANFTGDEADDVLESCVLDIAEAFELDAETVMEYARRELES